MDVTGTGKTDWNFTSRGPPFDSDRWDDLKSAEPFSQVNFQETHRRTLAPAGRPGEGRHPALLSRPPVTREDYASTSTPPPSSTPRSAGSSGGSRPTAWPGTTIVVFQSDHGEAHVRGKQFCYDSGLHIPLILAGRRFPAPPLPRRDGRRPPDRGDRPAADLLDVAAGVPKPAGMQGGSSSATRGPAPAVRLRRPRPLRRDGVPIPDGPRRPLPLHPQLLPDRPFLQPNEYKERSLPVWNLIKEFGPPAS